MKGTDASRWNVGLWSTGTGEWGTPAELRTELDREFGTDFDPCPLVTDGLRERDGFSSWHGRVFCNPPYGRVLPRWIQHGLRELAQGHCELIVWLLPARTDTAWFHDLVVPNAKLIRFLRGRIRFLGTRKNDRPAPFPSMIVVMERRP